MMLMMIDDDLDDYLSYILKLSLAIGWMNIAHPRARPSCVPQKAFFAAPLSTTLRDISSCIEIFLITLFRKN